MFKFKKKILLGSGSPRRKFLLKELGINFRALVSNTSEIPLPELRRGEIAKYLSDEKADTLKSRIHENEILITEKGNIDMFKNIPMEAEEIEEWMN